MLAGTGKLAPWRLARDHRPLPLEPLAVPSAGGFFIF